MQFYRYEEQAEEDSLAPPKLLCYEYSLEKETSCGYWIVPQVGVHCRMRRRWVSKTARKRYAYPSKAEALTALIARKRRQKTICEYQIDLAIATIIVAEKELLKLEAGEVAP